MFWRILLFLSSFFSTVFAVPESYLQKVYDEYVVAESAETLAERNEGFNRALKSYIDLERDYPFCGGQLYANIGNCFYQLREWGWAIYYYEKALQRMPRENSIKEKIKKIHLRAELPLKENRNFFLEKRVSFLEKEILFIVCFAFYILLSLYAKFFEKKCAKTWYLLSFSGGISLFFLLSLFGDVYFSKKEGIFISPVQLYKDVGFHCDLVKKKPFSSGEKVQVLESLERGEWLKVVTSDGSTGYVFYKCMRIL